MPEAAGALAAGVREIETACAMVKHEADSSSELIAMVYGMQDVECPTNKRRLCKENKKRQEATTALLRSILENLGSGRGDGRLLKWPSGASNNQDRV
jgi:hypothetical protein